MKPRRHSKRASTSQSLSTTSSWAERRWSNSGRVAASSEGASGVTPTAWNMATAPEDAAAVLRAGVRHLRESDVDLVFSNQAHPAWVAALRSMGFLEGPSNFAFFRAPAVTKLMGNGGSGLHAFVNRGDCDGPRFSQGGSP